jgi:hypothetical protein
MAEWIAHRSSVPDREERTADVDLILQDV